MLAHRGWLEGAHVVDLFAGSGALGIEALSRGAAGAVFVESAPAAVAALRRNLAASGCGERGEVLPGDALHALRTLARRGAAVDGVIADPPYGQAWPARILAAVVASGVLVPGGWVAVEHAADEGLEPPPGLAVVQRRRHGGTSLTLLVSEEVR
jgi:16S rRNA (guanine966-N2)-methyltransferase